jgi:multimeric flavodoxin WrbA
MKAVAFNGSPRGDGNTSLMIKRLLQTLESEGLKTELISLSGQPVRGCNACRICYNTQDRQCIIKGDKINEYITKMLEANVIILGSPVYFSMMTPELKALIDRAGYVARANCDMFKRKIGAAVVTARRAGAILTFDAINNFFLMSQIIVPGASYWNIGIGAKKGDVEKDEEATKTMENLGQNIAWLAKKIG